MSWHDVMQKEGAERQEILGSKSLDLLECQFLQLNNWAESSVGPFKQSSINGLKKKES